MEAPRRRRWLPVEQPLTRYSFPVGGRRAGPPGGDRVGSRHRLLAPLRLASVALTLVAAAGCSSGTGPARPSADHSAPTSPAAESTTTSPAPQYAPSPYVWDRSTSPALAVGGGPTADLATVLAPDPGGDWHIFGTRIDASGRPVATSWRSTDGQHWATSPIGDGSLLGSAHAAVRYQGTTVVVGALGEAANSQAAVWYSRAGGAFVPASVPLSDGPSAMFLVAVGSLGMFAEGQVDGRLAIWFSPTGRHWAEVPSAEQAITASPDAHVEALLADGQAVYAAGFAGGAGAPVAAVWSSRNGLNWHRVQDAQDAFAGTGGKMIYSLSPLGNGIVAVGAVQQGDGWVPASWISPNGESWSPPSTDFPGRAHPRLAATAYGPSGGSAARTVSPVESLAGATSVVAAGGGPYGQQAWSSLDGLHWQPTGMPSYATASTSWRATLVAATPVTTVVADSDAGAPYVLSDSGGRWTEPSADPTVFGAVQPEAVPVSLSPAANGRRVTLDATVVYRPQKIGQVRETTLTLGSTDGADWAAAAPDRPASLPYSPVAVGRTPSGWLAVSHDLAGPAKSWTSRDGHTWVPAGGLRAPDGGVGGGRGGGSGTTPTSGDSAVGRPSVPTIGDAVNAVCPYPGTAGRLPAGAATVAGPTTTTDVAAPRAVAVGATLSPESTPASPMAVGLDDGGRAAAWSWSGGSAWTSDAVEPVPAAGEFDSISGCTVTSSGLISFGSAPGPDGQQPAVWRAGRSATWSRLAGSGLGGGASSPLIGLAAWGDLWVGVANPDPSAAPLLTSAGGDLVGPAATAATAGATGPRPGVENGADSMWLSSDSGEQWQQIDTGVAPWLGTAHATIDLVGVLAPAGEVTGGEPGRSQLAAALPRVVVVGTVDGHLAVWVGTPAAPAAAGG